MMENKSNSRVEAIRYSLASVLFLLLGIFFLYRGDPIGTTIYGVGAAGSLLTAGFRYVKTE